MRATPHPRQSERLATLRNYRILDTKREGDFDEIVELASAICETPISVINLIDEHRQWFKAEVGLNADETPLETSLCSHVILEEAFVEISDTHKDVRMSDNPLCQPGDGLRFYAGAQLIASNGLPIGTLCVLDNKPRSLSPLQRRALEVLSRQVMKQMDLRVALHNQSVLQAEADHRVKNSLQSVAAIVRVYGRTVEDENAQTALGAIQRRIDAVASLHQQLQHTNGSDVLGTAAYLDRIVALLKETAEPNVTINSDFEDIQMRGDQASNIAMILSEFVANSLKHAFPDGKDGLITLRLETISPGQYRLECTDNGVGRAGDAASQSRGTGIGLSLVAAAASSLGANSTADLTPDGSHLILDFRDLPTEMVAEQTKTQSAEAAG